MTLLAHLISTSEGSFTLAALSIVLCPILCGVMAHRISHNYIESRDSKLHNVG